MAVKMTLNCHIGMNQSLNKNMSVYKDKIGEIWKKIKGQCQDFMSGCPPVPGYVQLSPKIEAGKCHQKLKQGNQNPISQRLVS